MAIGIGVFQVDQFGWCKTKLRLNATIEEALLFTSWRISGIHKRQWSFRALRAEKGAMKSDQHYPACPLAQCRLNQARLSLFVLLCLVGTDLTHGLTELSHQSEGAAPEEVVVSKVKLHHAEFNPPQSKTSSGARGTTPYNVLQQLSKFESAISLQGSPLLNRLRNQRTFIGTSQAEAQRNNGENPELKSSSLDVELREQLMRLNQVLSEGNVQKLLRFCAPNVRVDAPGRPGVQGHGADLVFALQTLFIENVSKSLKVWPAIINPAFKASDERECGSKSLKV